MKVQNTWNKGMNSDLSGLKTDGQSYLRAENFRIVSHEGQSTYALENTKGTSVCFKLPTTIYAVYKIDPQDYSGNPTIRLNNANISVVGIGNYSAKQLAELILQDAAVIASVANGDYTVQYNNNYVVVASLDSPMTVVQVAGVDIAPFVAEVNDTKIIGAINIKDYIIIFSTPNSQNPVSFPNLQSTGQIWRIRYDENTNLISGLVNNTLVPSVHLKKHDNFNWTQWRKISGEGRYEYEESQKVYFTDNFNNARLFNTTATNSFAIPLEVINIKPLHSTTTPVVQAVTDGGFIKNGSIQYFYHLQSNLGTETTFSEASNLISLTDSSLNSNYVTYQGGNQGVISGKAVSLQITGIDTNYDNIKVGYILWESENVATVRLFYEASVPPTGEILLTHSGSEDEIALTLEQYRALQAAFDRCKGFTQKKNILLAFNTHTNSFDVDIDTRAYRFSGIGANNLTNAPDQTAYLYNKEDTYGNPSIIIDGATSIWYLNGVAQNPTSPSPADWVNIPQEHDLINPYNQEDPNDLLNNNDWFNNSQFKYQADGSTLGGQGPIVSYTFVEKGDDLPNGGTNNYTDYGDEFQGPLSGFPSYGYPLIGNNMPQISGYTYTPGNGYSYPVNSGFSASKNPLLKSLFTGYASGEMYRFGVPFFNQRFQPSFVQWVGDIKFPFPQDGYHLFDWSNPGTSAGGYVTMRQMGIQFSLDTSHSQFQAIADEITGWSYVRVDRGPLDKTRLGVGLLHPVNQVTISGTDYFIPQYTALTASNNLATLENPNFKFDIGNGYTGADYIRHFYELFPTLSGSWTPNTDVIVGKWYDRTSTMAISDVVSLSGLLNIPVSTSQDIISASPVLPDPFINMSLPVGTDFEAWGGYTHLLSTVGLQPSAPNIWGTTGAPTGLFTRLSSYERYLDNQYNGNNWEVRLGQEYIGTTHFQVWDNSLTGIITSEVFGGDVLRTVFDWMKFDLNTTINNVSSGWNNPGTTNGFIQIFPTEVSFDLNLRQGFHAANKQGTTGEPNHDEFIYNFAYSQQNTSQAFFTIPYNFTEINENPYRIWASQEKFDGEFPDSWANWKSSDFIDVEGTFGPLNQMVLITDRVFYYQDYAIGVVAVKEQQLIEGANTTSLVLGEGSVLQRYDYVTKNTGCKHQWAVVVTPKGAYHADVSLKKIFLLQESGDKFGLTDIKGLNVEFQKIIQQRIKDTDLPLINGGVTIHGGWNPKHNEVFFTLLDNTTTNIGHIVGTGTTLTYNELTEGFDSFHSLFPSMYHRNQNHFLSVKPGSTDNWMWEHDTGSYNVYYDVLQPSTLKFQINLPPSTVSKRLDIIEFVTQVNETLANGNVGIDIPFETISTIRVYNSYQDTGVITLNPTTNFKKRFRTFRFNSIRDYVGTPATNPRQRDKVFIVEVTFNNPNNRRLVMNDVISDLDIQPY